MDEEHVFAADFDRELPQRFEKRQAFDVAGRPADFGDDDIGLRLLAEIADALFDLVGDVRDHLDRLAEVVAAPLLAQDTTRKPGRWSGCSAGSAVVEVNRS